MPNIRLYITLLAITIAASSCSSELTADKAMDKLLALDEFSCPYYAPLQIGETVLTGQGHTNSEQYLKQNYEPLIAAGLLKVDNSSRNSWRTVLKVELTAQGQAMCDKRRSSPTKAYVQVCRMVPDSIERLEVIEAGQTIDCYYRFTEQELTPFGKHLGFSQGRAHRDKLQLVRNSGWHIVNPTTKAATSSIDTPVLDTTETPIGEK